MTELLHPLFETPLPEGWQLTTVDAIKAKEPSSCVAGPFGSNISSKYFAETGIPIIRGSNLTADLARFRPEGFVFVSEERAQKYAPQHVRAGDLVFTCWGTIGQVGLIPEDGPYAEYIISNKQLKLRPDSGAADSEYLFFYFAGPKMVSHLLGKAIGAAVPGINLGILKELPVVLPPLPIQRRIAGILSAYDDLIENSQRRIKILEEMARGLYREWFVNFRFPGHEDCRFVDSPLGEIPEGWEIADLGDVCLGPKGIQTGPFGSQLHESDYSESGVPVVMPKDLIDFRIRAEGMSFIPEHVANTLSRHRVLQGDIIYGRRGDIGRRAFVMSHQTGWFCGTGCLRIRPDPSLIDGFYLFNYLGQDDVVAVIRGRAQGVTMPNLNTSLLATIPVRLPPRRIQYTFSDLSFPLASERELLASKIDNLRRTRHLLLPRLLSGQIDVEALPEPALSEA
jgi:type I restriction enzyme S subunit